MVEVFKTNIESYQTAHTILDELLGLFPDSKANFDLEDCDRILRVGGNDFSTDRIIEVVNQLGYTCEILE